jgi:hypothetical protein
LGAILTVVTVIIVLWLIFSELSTFFKIETVSRMVIDKGSSFEAVKLAFDIIFPFIVCSRLSYSQEVTKGTLHVHEKGDIAKLPIKADKGVEGCSVTGSFLIDKVGGNFKFSISESETSYNLSHIVNYVDFMPPSGDILDANAFGIPKHFNRSYVGIVGDISVYQYVMQIVPTQHKTLYGKLSFLNQYSVSEKPFTPTQVQLAEYSSSSPPKGFVGVMFTYDFNPVNMIFSIPFMNK